jgi:hypothetical protein
MVVSEHNPGVVVEVKAGNKTLKEHIDNDARQKLSTTSHYIEITSGTVFTISVTLEPSFKFKGDCLIVWINAGGEIVDDMTFEKGSTCNTWVSKGPARIGSGLKYRFEPFQKGMFRMLSPGTSAPADRFQSLMNGRSLLRRTR